MRLENDVARIDSDLKVVGGRIKLGRRKSRHDEKWSIGRKLKITYVYEWHECRGRVGKSGDYFIAEQIVIVVIIHH